jgi:hypothetical protein
MKKLLMQLTFILTLILAQNSLLAGTPPKTKPLSQYCEYKVNTSGLKLELPGDPRVHSVTKLLTCERSAAWCYRIFNDGCVDIHGWGTYCMPRWHDPVTGTVYNSYNEIPAGVNVADLLLEMGELTAD